MADTARRIPLEPDDLLLAGCVGKTFFAALALSLVHEGMLSLTLRSPPGSAQSRGFPVCRTVRRSRCGC
jgi:hypothetical protein